MEVLRIPDKQIRKAVRLEVCSSSIADILSNDVKIFKQKCKDELNYIPTDNEITLNIEKEFDPWSEATWSIMVLFYEGMIHNPEYDKFIEQIKLIEQEYSKQ